LKNEDCRTALHIACQRGHEHIIKSLLEHISDINIMSKNNKTPLDFAVGLMSSEFHMFEFDF
jgi:ankyrin repeat protein